MPTEGTTIEVPPLDFQPERRAAIGRRQNDVAIAAWLRGDTIADPDADPPGLSRLSGERAERGQRSEVAGDQRRRK